LSSEPYATPTTTDYQPDTTFEGGLKFTPSVISPKGNIEILDCTLPSLTVTLDNTTQSALKTECLIGWEITLSEIGASQAVFAINRVSHNLQITTNPSPLKLHKGTYCLEVSAKNLTSGYSDKTEFEAYVADDCSALTNGNSEFLSCGNIYVFSFIFLKCKYH
jgi:hypothetical protein